MFRSNFQYHLFFVSFVFLSLNSHIAFSQSETTHLQYHISIPQPGSHSYDLEFRISQWEQDTIHLKLPNWMPGYYQMMYYAKDLENFMAKDEYGNHLPIDRLNDNTWRLTNVRNKHILVNYRIRTHRQFVANSYVDNDHAYLVPGNTFLYVEGFLQVPVLVKVQLNPEWDRIATGLESVKGKTNEFLASDFDILYDCPILIGNLEELPSFEVKGVAHRFIGYRLGDFDRIQFMDNLQKTVQAAVDIIGDIPYEQYSFIAIGPGYGGIEHLNNTTVSFDGNRLSTTEGRTSMMSFLAHEYFHHYNVKRIRPYELGPFDYDKGNRSNLLWLSEGFTVYYELMILRKAGLIDAETFLSHFSEELNSLENDSGRFHQSLSQASYSTWEDGPFGNSGKGSDQSISIYNKGAIIALLLDLEIRFATQNNKSLDDVMRTLYRTYYIEKKRGFTDAEFQTICEEQAGISLTHLFEYVYTTKELDYDRYLSHAGLGISMLVKDSDQHKDKIVINRLSHPNQLQSNILNSWLEE